MHQIYSGSAGLFLKVHFQYRAYTHSSSSYDCIPILSFKHFELEFQNYYRALTVSHLSYSLSLLLCVTALLYKCVCVHIHTTALLWHQHQNVRRKLNCGNLANHSAISFVLSFFPPFLYLPFLLVSLQFTLQGNISPVRYPGTKYTASPLVPI